MQYVFLCQVFLLQFWSSVLVLHVIQGHPVPKPWISLGTINIHSTPLFHSIPLFPNCAHKLFQVDIQVPIFLHLPDLVLFAKTSQGTLFCHQTRPDHPERLLCLDHTHRREGGAGERRETDTRAWSTWIEWILEELGLYSYKRNRRRIVKKKMN